ncbi:calcium-binding protein [Nostoc linckia FACHB-391]|uniref:Calcium-binding protein n=2 Tax=Nostoc TaxID=1177 RepID=A0ABR8IAZ6_9NOSO|nr:MULTISPECIES: calcium-binding protein [Nostoc]MBD2563991.1 calcium-binding protein [Nostoc linckia FACHB-391]MBD2648034.1 calcium-binding protein [Nostoc foliaceum FACHB-393]
MADIIGTNGNDTLVGSDSADTINGKAGNDTIRDSNGDDTLTGGGGKDLFIYDYYSGGMSTITDFGGIGKGTNPTAAVTAEVDTIKFLGLGLTAENLLLTQNGSNLEITFEDVSDAYTKVILQNFTLENLENLSKSTGATVDLGNLLFDGETSISDSFDVFNANSTQSSIFKKNTVTFLNDLNNNVKGFDNSDDVINGQGGNDKIDGKSGNDLLRGGMGNDTLIGGAGNDTLIGDAGNNLLFGGDGNDSLFTSYFNNVYYIDTLDIEFSTGDSTLSGGAGNDTLSAEASTGNNLLFGGDGNDSLSTSYFNNIYGYIASSGNNTLRGGAGDDTLRAEAPEGNNLLFGGDGNDSLSTSGYYKYRGYFDFISSGNNTLRGGVGDDTLRAEYSTGNNLLSGGDGNDSLSTSGYLILYSTFDIYYPSTGNNTLNGGAGDDTLRAEYSTGNNLLSGGDGNDSFYLSTTSPDTAPSYLATQTVQGGKGDDLLSVNYSNATGGITTTFNATTNIGSITAGTYRVSYKNIERLNIRGTAYDDLIVGSNGNDTLSGGYGGNSAVDGSGGNDTVDGGKGEDLLSANYTFATGGITTTFNATTNIGSITAGTNLVSYKNIERLDIRGTAYDDLIVGSNGNDTLSTGDGGKDTIDGGRGEDLLFVNYRSSTVGITSTFNATTNIGSITAGTNQVSYKNIERLNISGTRYDDLIVGSNGNDTLSGSDGNDNLYGGGSTDTFAINSFYEGVDSLYDFDTTNELIQISAFGFFAGFGSGLSVGSLQTSQFTIGTSASTIAQRFIYDNSTGGLYFDADGNAGGFTQVKFAQLSTGLSLTNNNFVVV